MSETAIEFLRVPGLDPDQLMEHGLAAASLQGLDEAAPDDPPELAAAIAHLQAERFEQALVAALPHVNAAQHQLRIDALRLCALATARLDQWEASLGYWKDLFEQEPTALNALQVGTTSAMTGQEWIARARELNATAREMPDLQIVTNTIGALTRAGHMDQALPYLEELRGVYMSLNITDPTFLHLRHVPFLEVFLEHSLPVVRAVLSVEEGRGWYAAMLAHLDAPGQDTINAWLAAHFAATTAPA